MPTSDFEVVLGGTPRSRQVVVTVSTAIDKNSFAGSAKTYTSELRAIRNEERLPEPQTLEPRAPVVENRAFGADPNGCPIWGNPR